jgi:hypothetical protein
MVVFAYFALLYRSIIVLRFAIENVSQKLTGP